MGRARELALVAGVAVSGVVAESSAQDAGRDAERSRAFRLVDDRLDAADLRHARLVQTLLTRGDRTGTFTLGLSAGLRETGLAELNRELERNGYSTVGTRSAFGLGLAGFTGGAFGAVFFEGGPHAIRGFDGIDGDVGYFDFMLQAGPAFDIRDAAIIYPFAGIGIGSINVGARTADASRVPILRGQIPSIPKGFNVNSSFGVFEIGAGALVPLPIISKPGARYGVSMSTELAYALSFAESDWRDGTAGPQSPSYRGPSSSTHGAGVRFWLRYEYDGFEVQTESRPMSSCSGRGCRAYCDAGFADCDADPRNGCETALGTIENCGACGDACMVRHGAALCRAPDVGSPSCLITACDPGFVDCNGRPSDGCETFVLLDSFNCGACGHLCTPLDRCVSGQCVPKSESDDVR